MNQSEHIEQPDEDSNEDSNEEMKEDDGYCESQNTEVIAYLSKVFSDKSKKDILEALHDSNWNKDKAFTLLGVEFSIKGP